MVRQLRLRRRVVPFQRWKETRLGGWGCRKSSMQSCGTTLGSWRISRLAIELSPLGLVWVHSRTPLNPHLLGYMWIEGDTSASKQGLKWVFKSSRTRLARWSSHQAQRAAGGSRLCPAAGHRLRGVCSGCTHGVGAYGASIGCLGGVAHASCGCQVCILNGDLKEVYVR